MKAKVFTKLFYRHWDEYVGDKRQHLFVQRVATPHEPEPGACRDVTPGDRDAYPTVTTFSSGDDFTFTPDSKHLVFTAVPEKDEAWSTNYDICRVRIDNTSHQVGEPDGGQQGRRQRAAVQPGRQEAGVAGTEDSPATRRTSGTSSSWTASRTARSRASQSLITRQPVTDFSVERVRLGHDLGATGGRNWLPLHRRPERVATALLRQVIGGDSPLTSEPLNDRASQSSLSRQHRTAPSSRA